MVTLQMTSLESKRSGLLLQNILGPSILTTMQDRGMVLVLIHQYSKLHLAS